jgi:hypothetical protein
MLRTVVGVALASLALAQPGDSLADRIVQLTRDSTWTRVQAVPIAFRTFHPQGMVKIGDALFVSSVEVRVPTRRGPQPDTRYDRDAGEGVGHLFQIDMSGKLVADLILGEGSIYHPGGMDYDGTSIWVAVAEYRPDSRSIVYRVDPSKMTATEALRVADHIGALAYDTDDRTLHGVSWGARRFYRWHVGADGKIVDGGTPLDRLRTLNPSHYLDYQDCKYAGQHRMFCTGVTEYRPTPGAPPFRLGGLDLVDLRDGRPLHQVPVQLWTTGGLDMTHIPSWLESTATGLRAWFLPDDDSSTLYVFDARTRP